MKEAWWLIDQFVQQGVITFCVAPGSRSTPLVQAAASHPRAKTVVHFDERGLAFYALGSSKATKRPTAIITTSGTAAANLLPAVMEAYHSATPLILLTADRPHELRDCGANQTADQTKLFANAIRWQMDLSSHLNEPCLRSIAAQAVFHTISPTPGPVHLNCPFQDPLYDLQALPLPQGKEISLIHPTRIAPPLSVEASKGVILIGRVPDPAPILQLAHKLRWPVFADILSNARCTPTPEQILHFDFLIRSPLPLKPDLIIHFGERLVSKQILQWEKEVPFFHVSPLPFLQDPERRITSRIHTDIEPFCITFQARSEARWLAAWQAYDREVHSVIEEQFKTSFTEAHLYRALPKDRPLFLGNGLPIRDADHFLSCCSIPFCNRGLSGIDGNIATAAGICDALAKPLVAVIGDQAALHDLNSFPLLKDRPILLILSNNFGGGIFEHLPIAQSPFFETHFAAAHCWHFKNLAAMFDLPYVCCRETPSVWPDSGIVELITNRKTNHCFQKELTQACSTVLSCKKGEELPSSSSMDF